MDVKNFVSHFSVFAEKWVILEKMYGYCIFLLIFYFYSNN